MSKYPWRILYSNPGKKYAGFTAIENVSDIHQRFDGVSLAKRWPDDAVTRMDPNYKKNVALGDIHDGLATLFVSRRFADIVRGLDEEGAELLPLTVINHKGKPVPEPYYLLNGTRVVDCIDTKASKIRWNAIDESSISGVIKLVLDSAKLPKKGHIFRPKHWTSRHLVSDQLVEALEAADMEGLHTFEVEEYVG